MLWADARVVIQLQMWSWCYGHYVVANVLSMNARVAMQLLGCSEWFLVDARAAKWFLGCSVWLLGFLLGAYLLSQVKDDILVSIWLSSRFIVSLHNIYFFYFQGEKSLALEKIA